MVKYRSDDGVFDAPVDKIWKFIGGEGRHDHESLRNLKPVKEGDNIVVMSGESKNPDGTWSGFEIKMTMNPPKGFESETLSGPMKGSKYSHTYVPDGDKTKVILEGDFQIAGMTDEGQVKKAVDSYFNHVFEEDNKNLKEIK